MCQEWWYKTIWAWRIILLHRRQGEQACYSKRWTSAPTSTVSPPTWPRTAKTVAFVASWRPVWWRAVVGLAAGDLTSVLIISRSFRICRRLLGLVSIWTSLWTWVSGRFHQSHTKNNSDTTTNWQLCQRKTLQWYMNCRPRRSPCTFPTSALCRITCRSQCNLSMTRSILKNTVPNRA